MTSLLNQFKNILFSKTLPSHDDLFSLAQETADILEAEKYDYREESAEGIPGGLLDFSRNKLPMIVIPDIHARPDFIYNILSFRLPNRIIHKKISVISALQKNLIRIVCVGDALHTERTKLRWLEALQEYTNTYYTGPAMTEEMRLGLNTISALMKLKILFPQNFHFLKGNHENIYNKTGQGDFAFRKYADEGNMVRRFMYEYYGDDVLFMLSCVENAMPLMAFSDNCVISHAEPSEGFKKNEIINARLYPQVIRGLTWTDNDEAVEGSADQVIKNLITDDGCKSNIPYEIQNYVYLGGHRTVPGLYLTRQNGRYIQFHNSKMQNIAFVRPGEKFIPEQDIVSVEKKEFKS